MYGYIHYFNVVSYISSGYVYRTTMNHEPTQRMQGEPQAPPGFSVKRSIYAGFVYNLIYCNMIHFGDEHPP